MWQRKSELEALGIDVNIVTFQAGPLVEAYVRETGLHWPILIDDTLSLYRSYGMDHGNWWDIWGPPAIWVYIKLMSRGRMPKSPAGDVHQLGGDVLIDPAGVVRLHHVGKGPADRPSVDSLIAVVRPSGGASSSRVGSGDEF